MAAPNIVSVASIYGRVAGQAVGITTTAIVTNGPTSGKVFKVNSLVISNVHGTDAADITATLNKNQATEYHLTKTVTVPADATLVVISKDTSIYLEENDSVDLVASVASKLEAVCSYEEISE